MIIATIVGARPQFIKASTVSRAIAMHNANLPAETAPIAHSPSPIHETIIHTGQHFDDNMSQFFFDELQIPKPDYHLGVSGGGHGAMTGAMLAKMEPMLQEIGPDWVLVYGDTNSTLAGALAAAKLHIPVAHVEAGLRSFNRRMPEEINRIVSDQLSTILFCPTETAVKNLKAEGYPHKVSAHKKQQIANIGDVMFDAALFFGAKAEEKSQIIHKLNLTPKDYVLATVHRAENTDDPQRLTAIIDVLVKVSEKMPVILPLHPRTRKKLEALDPEFLAHCSSLITLIDPLGYLDMVQLEKNAAVVATDSGGVQKEAYFHGIPCVTLREETEWVELVESGWNRLARPGRDDIQDLVLTAVGSKGQDARPYGEGNAAELIIKRLLSNS